MTVITLISDWGLKDHYLGAVKGKLMNFLPDARIVDISHSIPPFNTTQAAFILKNVYKNFPIGTIHIIALNTEESDKYPHTIVEAEGQYFIGTDNGIFSLIFDEKPDRIIEMNIPQDSDYFTFSTLDRFAKAAIELAHGNVLASLGEEKENLIEKLTFRPVTDKNLIKGMVIYIDNYENVIVNITSKLFEELRRGRNFEILLRGETITSINKSYNDVGAGDVLALFGSHGFLEIAINQGNASSLLGLKMDDLIRVEFQD